MLYEFYMSIQYTIIFSLINFICCHVYISGPHAKFWLFYHHLMHHVREMTVLSLTTLMRNLVLLLLSKMGQYLIYLNFFFQFVDWRENLQGSERMSLCFQIYFLGWDVFRTFLKAHTVILFFFHMSNFHNFLKIHGQLVLVGWNHCGKPCKMYGNCSMFTRIDLRGHKNDFLIC